jgi:hypothetical protein
MRAALPADAVLSGLSAAWAHGVFEAGPQTPVEVILPPSRRVRSRSGLVVRGDVLKPAESVHTEFGRATSGARTAFDLARSPTLPPATAQTLLGQLLDRRVDPGLVPNLDEGCIADLARAVAQVDAVLRATGDSVEAVELVAKEHPGTRGSKVLRVVLALADPRAESPPESVVRTLLVLAGLPWPVPQYVVLGPDGEFVARVDLAWPELRLAIEYDGAHHDERRQFRADRARDTRLQLAGWRPIHLDANHLRHPQTLLAMLRQAVLL